MEKIKIHETEYEIISIMLGITPINTENSRPLWAFYNT